MEWIIGIALSVIALVVVASWWALFLKIKKIESEPTNLIIEDKPPKVIEKHIPVSPDFKALEKVIGDLPHKVLKSLEGSTNNMKGNLGEYMSYLKLSSAYDRVICRGNIVDFICIRFPSEDYEGTIDFIDIKTGRHARLSKDQNRLKKLIEAGRTNFVKVTVQTESDVKQKKK